jgi:hypothetical protein
MPRFVTSYCSPIAAHGQADTKHDMLAAARGGVMDRCSRET